MKVKEIEFYYLYKNNLEHKVQDCFNLTKYLNYFIANYP
jgi:hypothetical protein